MEPFALMWVTVLVAVAVPLAMVGLKWLHPHRDFFFLLIYLQVVIYLHVAPTLAAQYVDDGLRSLYMYMEVLSVTLFDIPFVLLYAWGMSRPAGQHPVDHMQLRSAGARTVLLSVFAMAFSALFVYIVLRYQLLYVRIGGEALVQRYASLPFAIWFAYRLFAETGGFLAAVLLLALLRADNVPARSAAATALLFTLATYGIHTLVNSRLDSAVLIVMLAGVFLYWRRVRPGARSVSPAVWVAAGLLTLYAFKVVNNIRYNYLAYGEIRAEWFNPLFQSPTEVVGEATPLPVRLNGLDLMAQMTPKALQEGFALGKAWEGVLAPIVLTLIDRDRANELKESFSSDPTNYLMAHYTTFFHPDYFSSALTDAYGNFGLFGLLLVVVVLGFANVKGTRWVQAGVSRNAPLLGLFVIYCILPFEHQLITTILQFVRYAPMLVAVLILNPLTMNGTAASARAAGALTDEDTNPRSPTVPPIRSEP